MTKIYTATIAIMTKNAQGFAVPLDQTTPLDQQFPVVTGLGLYGLLLAIAARVTEEHDGFTPPCFSPEDLYKRTPYFRYTLSRVAGAVRVGGVPLPTIGFPASSGAGAAFYLTPSQGECRVLVRLHPPEAMPPAKDKTYTAKFTVQRCKFDPADIQLLEPVTILGPRWFHYLPNPPAVLVEGEGMLAMFRQVATLMQRHHEGWMPPCLYRPAVEARMAGLLSAAKRGETVGQACSAFPSLSDWYVAPDGWSYRVHVTFGPSAFPGIVTVLAADLL